MLCFLIIFCFCEFGTTKYLFVFCMLIIQLTWQHTIFFIFFICVCVCVLCSLVNYMSMEDVFKCVSFSVFDLVRAPCKKQMVVIVLAHNKTNKQQKKNKKLRTTKLSHLHTGEITDQNDVHLHIEHNPNSAQITIWYPQSHIGHTHT